MAKKTHHKHSSSKKHRKLLDAIEAHHLVHSVATGKVKPRRGLGRPVSMISKARKTKSGLSITINVSGAIIDAYVVTSHPDEVKSFFKKKGWVK